MLPAHFHDAAGYLFTIVEKVVLSHRAMLPKFVLYLCYVWYCSQCSFIFRDGLL